MVAARSPRVAIQDAITAQYAAKGKNVTIVGLTSDSAVRLAGTWAP